MNSTKFLRSVILLLGLAAAASAQVPLLLNHQGLISAGGTNFTGTGQFQFALVDQAGTTTFWSNGTSVVTLPVNQGLYAVLLGDTNVTAMAALSVTTLTNADVRLRVWFNDGGTGSQLLTPDQRIAALEKRLAEVEQLIRRLAPPTGK